ncbi:MAG TPA: hypothetical protein VMW27_16370 [Thermoanaerobaculia bacterium]|nr:hypothetical protein [Thermoanaerobaculia bacterium]
MVWALSPLVRGLACLEEPEDAPAELQWSVVRIVSDGEGGCDLLTFLEV